MTERSEFHKYSIVNISSQLSVSGSSWLGNQETGTRYQP